ncbi:acetyl-CoA hydrolase/transferase C-terminal domain-containing protein [Pseudomonas sp. RL_15y_Pfl2_60]|uniref:acetyl-CoA hydrolase/transferase C-terminal domain-containing protein n=1 Tax=Pseudomonas sp. RL_15y_Pfl2_60 TaxID=3088709 RepID=UPI0030D8EE5A
MPQLCSIDDAVERVLREIDGPIHLGLPLGLGKPNTWVNALYQRCKQLPERELNIYTALCLGRPHAEQGLQQRFLQPFVERVFADYPELDFLGDLRRGELPANIRVEQFFMQPASMLNNDQAQQNYVSSNYSHAARDINSRGLNVLAQLVATDPLRPEHFSLSCNPDITLDLLPMLDKRRANGEKILYLAQVHSQLPYMAGDAEIACERFDIQLQDAETSALFSTPNMPISLQDHCIGMHASTLVRDGGTLQIGIGSMGDAVTAALLARHSNNSQYKALLDALNCTNDWHQWIERVGGTAAFDQGLYGCSEMFVNGLLLLADAGIIRRAVYPELLVQQLACAGALDDHGRPRSVQALLDAGLASRLDEQHLAELQGYGLLAPEIREIEGQLSLPSNLAVPADLADAQTQQALAEYLRPANNAVVLHGGFFLGPRSFYERLNELSFEQRRRYAMTGICFINELYGQEQLKRLQRRDARFINTAFTMTLMGAAVSDQLENGRVLSGVGGQYNFVAQGHALEDARSILLLRSWREADGEVRSNIVWEYGHVTIPRHLRDIVVSEYGIADLRGKSDSQVIEALLKISDSRFQAELIAQAQANGKLDKAFELDAAYGNNLPERLEALQLEHGALFDEFALGCDFTPVERDLLRALTWLKRKFKLSEILRLGKATLDAPEPEAFMQHLQRMGLAQPDGLREELYQRLVLAGLQATQSSNG